MGDREWLGLICSGFVAALLFSISEIGFHFFSQTGMVIFSIALLFACGSVLIFGGLIYFSLKKCGLVNFYSLTFSGVTLSNLAFWVFREVSPWEYPLASLIGLVSGTIFFLFVDTDSH